MALDRLREALGEALFGQEEVIEALLAVLLARGHALLEGMPGLGKTLLAESLARASASRSSRAASGSIPRPGSDHISIRSLPSSPRVGKSGSARSSANSSAESR